MSVLWPAVAVGQEPAVEPDHAVEPQRVECAEAPAVFELLCLSYEKLKVNYVDDVADVEWAEAAANGVREAASRPTIRRAAAVRLADPGVRAGLR